ncbi:MAG TPA: histidine phosphatase family protein [Planctomycetota bacterium]|nr:histidine phosphatase family protein [Planctomycetota bacterium]
MNFKQRRWQIFFGVLLAGWLLGRVPFPHQLVAWAGSPSCVDGDVNGDGALNIADPIRLLAFLFQGGDPPTTCSAAAGRVSPVFVVRHAEKDGECLSAEGKDRAVRLGDVFKYAKVNHLVASTICRTKETLEPLAAVQKIPATEIAQVGDLEVASAKEVVKLVRTYPAGDVTVVCHHSTTVEAILIELGIDAAEAHTVDTNAYDNLLLVMVPAGSAAPQLVKLAYK